MQETLRPYKPCCDCCSYRYTLVTQGKATWFSGAVSGHSRTLGRQSVWTKKIVSSLNHRFLWISLLTLYFSPVPKPLTRNMCVDVYSPPATPATLFWSDFSPARSCIVSNYKLWEGRDWPAYWVVDYELMLSSDGNRLLLSYVPHHPLWKASDKNAPFRTGDDLKISQKFWRQTSQLMWPSRNFFLLYQTYTVSQHHIPRAKRWQK